jgi:hypothetical protein
MATWEFHFRDLNTNGQDWFGVYHAGCGGTPWHEGRPKCWDCTIENNPTGGDSSVYVPASFVVNFGAWFQVILAGLTEVANIGMAIASEGEDAADAISGAFDVASDVVKAEMAAAQMNDEDLTTLLNQNFNNACAAAGRTPAEITAYAAQLGLTNWAFISGSTYTSLIHDDNSTVNGGYGWTILHSPPGEPVNYLVQAAFVAQGHLIFLWDPSNLGGLWTPFS